MDQETLKFLQDRAKSHNARWGHLETKFCDINVLIEIYNRNEYYCKLFPQNNKAGNNRVLKKRIQDYMRVLRWGFVRDVMDTLVWEDLELLPQGHRMHSPHKISIYTELDTGQPLINLEPNIENQHLVKELIEKMQTDL
jgi:hypothetical protein